MIASIIKGLRPITRPQLLYGVYKVPLLLVANLLVRNNLSGVITAFVIPIYK